MADLYTDHNVSERICDGLRLRRHAIVTTWDHGLYRAGDDLQLLTAAEHGWILVTCDREDFGLLHDAWRRWSKAWGVSPVHAGIIVFRQSWPIERAVQELDGLLSTVERFANELFEWIPSTGWTKRP